MAIPIRVTHQYDNSVGEMLAEVSGTRPSYKLDGDEIYVRAKVVSTKPMGNPYREGEMECAWIQPVVAYPKPPNTLSHCVPPLKPPHASERPRCLSPERLHRTR